MATARDLVKRSLKIIGAIGAGETPSAEESIDAMAVLNQMLANWSVNGLLVNAVKREEFNLIGSQQVYTMGTSGSPSFNTARPVKILKAGVIKSNVEIPVELINYDQWAAITSKTNTSSIPQKLYSEGTFPNETLNLWPIPNEANKLVIYSQKQLTSFANLTDQVAFPPGYEMALAYNLALFLYPEYGMIIDPNVATLASDLKADIQRQNIVPVYMKTDAPMTSSMDKTFNWLTGE